MNEELQKTDCNHYRESDGNCLHFTYPGEYDPCTDGDLESCRKNYPHFFQKNRFEIKDRAIVDTKECAGQLEPFIVEQAPARRGENIEYADYVSVCNFMNRQEILIRAKENHINKMVKILHDEIENAESEELKLALKRVAAARL